MPNATFTLSVVVVMVLGITIAAGLAISAARSAPVAPATHQPTLPRQSETPLRPTPVNLDEIKEPSVRALFDDQGYFFGPDQRLAQIARKHEGGFGGYSFDRTDRSHVYVYMVDITKTEAAEAAFREAYGDGMHKVTKITPVQGQFPFDQLVQWFPVVDRALLANGIHPTTGAVMELCNRIRFGLRDESLIVDARSVVADLGIPQDAVFFEQSRPVLLGDDREPLLRPVIEWFKEIFRGGDDDEPPRTYGPGRC